MAEIISSQNDLLEYVLREAEIFCSVKQSL